MGLIYKGKPFSHEHVFIGQMKDKFYLVIKNSSNSEEVPCDFEPLESDLFQVQKWSVKEDMDWPNIRKHLTLFSKYSKSDNKPMMCASYPTGEFEFKFNTDLNLGSRALNSKGPKSGQHPFNRKSFELKASNPSDDKILKFLSAPPLDEEAHKLDCCQNDLTSAPTRDMKSYDEEKRGNALAATMAFAMVKEVDRALEDISSNTSPTDSSHLLSSLRGPIQVAIKSLEPLVSNLLQQAKDQRKFVRSKAAINIKEAPVRQPLIENEPWAESLFPSNAGDLVTESMKTPALRKIQTFKQKGSQGPNPISKLMKISRNRGAKTPNRMPRALMRQLIAGSSDNSKGFSKHTNSDFGDEEHAFQYKQRNSFFSREQDHSGRKFRGRGRGKKSSSTHNFSNPSRPYRTSRGRPFRGAPHTSGSSSGSSFPHGSSQQKGSQGGPFQQQ